MAANLLAMEVLKSSLHCVSAFRKAELSESYDSYFFHK